MFYQHTNSLLYPNSVSLLLSLLVIMLMLIIIIINEIIKLLITIIVIRSFHHCKAVGSGDNPHGDDYIEFRF